jgi:hypothetical protein
MGSGNAAENQTSAGRQWYPFFIILRCIHREKPDPFFFLPSKRQYSAATWQPGGEPRQGMISCLSSVRGHLNVSLLFILIMKLLMPCAIDFGDH